MKRYLILALLLFLAWPSDAGMLGYYGGVVGEAPATFCDTAGIFCMDAEQAGQVTMQAGTSDIALDDDGDYYLQYAAVHKNGSYALAIRGSGATYYSRDALDSSVSEFYVEFWYRNNADRVADARVLIFEDSSNAAVVTVSRDANEGVNVICNGTTFDPGNSHIPENTWVHIGLYYKEETGAGNNDGIVRVWLETDGDGFEAVEMLINQTSVDTVSNDAAKIRMSGPYSGKISYRDDVRVVSGAPSWPTS